MTESTYAFDKTRALADLPNREGFKFIGVRKDGTTVDCQIATDPETGTFRVAGGAVYEELTGWRYKK